jgi:S-adenosyl-l-methionine hydroxide adenosyltransferase
LKKFGFIFFQNILLIMFVTIITDCIDSGTFGRQLTRVASIFGFSAIPVAINPDFESLSDLEAGGHLIDILDASRGEPGIILVNKAPRSGKAKKWPNGTPFGYFWYNKTLIVSSVDGLALSMVKKFKILEEVKVMDIPTIMSWAKEKNLIDDFEANYVVETQFRSFEFLPRVAKWIWDRETPPSTSMKVKDIEDCPNAIFYIDNFGNLKTTILPEEVNFEKGAVIKFENFGELKCYTQLKDLPNGETGLIIGSSGLKERRLLEIITQGGSAAQKFGSKIGDKINVVS